MADKRISELNEHLGSDILNNDILMVVSSNGELRFNKRLSLETLFNNIPTYLKFKNYDTVDSTNLISSSNTAITHINGSSDQILNMNIENGSQGQYKILTMTNNQGYSVIVNGSNIIGINSIEFNNEGNSLTLLYTNNNWTVLSSYGVIIS